MSPLQVRVMHHLATAGAMSTVAVARAIGASVSGVDSALKALSDAGAVRRRSNRLYVVTQSPAEAAMRLAPSVWVYAQRMAAGGRSC